MSEVWLEEKVQKLYAEVVEGAKKEKKEDERKADEKKSKEKEKVETAVLSTTAKQLGKW